MNSARTKRGAPSNGRPAAKIWELMARHSGRSQQIGSLLIGAESASDYSGLAATAHIETTVNLPLRQR